MAKTVSHPNQQSRTDNLLINGGFRVWQRGTSFTLGVDQYGPDMWREEGTTSGSIPVNRTTGSKFGKYACLVEDNLTDATSRLIQIIENAEDLQGKTITLSAWVKEGPNNPSNNAGIRIDDEDGSGNGSSSIETVSTTSNFQKLTVTHEVPSDAVDVRITLVPASGDGTEINSETGETIFDGVMMTIGEFPTEYQPRPIGMEQSLAQRYYVLMENCTWYGWNENSSNTVRNQFMFHSEKSAIPTVTINTKTSNNINGGIGPRFEQTKHGATVGVATSQGLFDWIGDIEAEVT